MNANYSKRKLAFFRLKDALSYYGENFDEEMALLWESVKEIFLDEEVDVHQRALPSFATGMRFHTTLSKGNKSVEILEGIADSYRDESIPMKVFQAVNGVEVNTLEVESKGLTVGNKNTKKSVERLKRIESVLKHILWLKGDNK